MRMSYRLSSFAIALLITCLLTLLEILIFTNFAHVFVLVMSMPVLLGIPLFELMLITVLLLWARRPFAIWRYLRTLRQFQAKAHESYVSFSARVSLQQASEQQRSENSPLLVLLRQAKGNQIVLASSGSGKTVALRELQYDMSYKPLSHLFTRKRVPVYLSLRGYVFFLQRQQIDLEEDASARENPQAMLLTYLEQSDAPAMWFLREHIVELFKRGRLLLLCDGLDEVESEYQEYVSESLANMMRNTQNRFILTGREIDYWEQSGLETLVEEGIAERVEVFPLDFEGMQALVEQYVQKQNNGGQHTAGQVMQVIETSRLRDHCATPFFLFLLLDTIEAVGVEDVKQSDTRGLLMRAYCTQFIQRLLAEEQKSATGEQLAFEEVAAFLSYLACAIAWADEGIVVAHPSRLYETEREHLAAYEELARTLVAWVNEHPAQTPFIADEVVQDIPAHLPTLLRLLVQHDLMRVSDDGTLNFRHASLRAYFVAEYYSSLTPADPSQLMQRPEIIEDIDAWSEVVALWAGLLEDPLALAESFTNRDEYDVVPLSSALALGLLCAGVAWFPPQMQPQQPTVLPEKIEKTLLPVFRDELECEQLVHAIMRCVAVGGPEVYRGLLSLVMLDEGEELLLMLEPHSITDLLFNQLQDAADLAGYDGQVKRLTRVLGRFGEFVVGRASRMTLPQPESSLRLRVAAINILGGTDAESAVDPLLDRLRESEPFIVARATHALIRLGPHYALAKVLRQLGQSGSDSYHFAEHQAALIIVERFLDDVSRTLSATQYQQVLDHLLPVLTARYQDEDEVQQHACEILIKLGKYLEQTENADPLRVARSEQAMQALVATLNSQDEVGVRNAEDVFQTIGAPAVPFLIEGLRHSSEHVRARAVDILAAIHDARALPGLLLVLDDPVLSVQQAAAEALQIYAPESIAGLIDVILTGRSDTLADHASRVLVQIGEPAVMPVAARLKPAVAERTQFLVQVLGRVHDMRALPALIDLLEEPQLEPLLVIAIVRVLGLFEDASVVVPLLRVLVMTNPLLYEEAITTLSQLGKVALPDLSAALDVEQDTMLTQRIRRAIAGMTPFPGERLVATFAQSGEVQGEQILAIFRMRGRDAAPILVHHLLDTNEHVRLAMEQTLQQMSGSVVVPALLEALQQPELRSVVSSLLLKYPDEALPALVNLLGEPERGPVVVSLLPRYGTITLRPLVAGLDDARPAARASAQRVLLSLTQQQPASEQPKVLREILQLFTPPPPPRAHETLIEAFTDEFGQSAVSVLLESLQNMLLIQDVAEIFCRLAQKPQLHNEILDRLINALFNEERRQGAEIALIRIGAPAVSRVGDLIIDADVAVARSAQHILSDIGVPALAYIWNAYSDRNNETRQQAARAVFQSMPPEVIKDELISLLVSNDQDDISMAVSLLQERVRQEATRLKYEEQVMVPDLIDYVQSHSDQSTNLRIISLLLLLGEKMIIDHLIQALEYNPQHRKQLTYIFLLFSEQSQELLRKVFTDPNVTTELRADIAGVLSMIMPPDYFTPTIHDLATNGLFSAQRVGSLYSDELTIGLRALGGLLASGQWHARQLQVLRDAVRNDDPTYELFNVLLGWRYEPQIAKLQQDMEKQRDSFKKEILSMTATITEKQQRVSSLESELEKVQEEHGMRGDELKDVMRRRDSLQANVDKLTRENATLRASLEQLRKDRERERAASSSQNLSLPRRRNDPLDF